MSFKLRLSLVFTFFTLLMIFQSVTSFLGSKNLVHKLNDISQIQLPAVRNMTLVDMYHDSLLSICYRALFYSENTDQELKKEIANDFKESSELIVKALNEINELGVKEDTKMAIKEAMPDVENYLKVTEEVVALSLASRKDLAVKKIDNLQKSFRTLEVKLDQLGELIKSDAAKIQKHSNADAENILYLSPEFDSSNCVNRVISIS